VLNRWQGWLAAAGVTAAAAVLVALDLNDDAFRRWWLRHALTTGVVTGLLVLLITVLVADQVVRLRQLSDRARAVAAQAAIMAGQAKRSAGAVSAVLAGTGDRAGAADEVRTYMFMLFVAAPVLIDDRVSRRFLEEAQYLGGSMAQSLGALGEPSGTPEEQAARLGDAAGRLQAAAVPLLAALNPEERTAAAENGSV
jgi:hypothetical protein